MRRDLSMHVMSGLLSDATAPNRIHAGLDVLSRLLRAVPDMVARVGRRTRCPDEQAPVGGKRRAPGHVALVGAGPGDPELLTLKALRALRTADVVLYDHLVSEEVLALVPPTADRIAVGKKGYGGACKQGDINVLMVALAAAGRRVVRLKAGDPLMFGRLEEEIAALADAGLEFSVVPGISAAQGAAAALNIPLTRRRGARRFQAITGHADDGRLPDDFDWSGLADPKATTAVYMPKATIGDLCAELIRRGLDAAHPAVAVFNATRASELVLSATLATLPERVGAAACEGPCIILIGAAVAGRARATAYRATRIATASGTWGAADSIG
jgi:uroporphyrin-III C-methyltransferase / precorrin-2 dehydrogenase / sirohydrochlorin ferrochelatase